MSCTYSSLPITAQNKKAIAQTTANNLFRKTVIENSLSIALRSPKQIQTSAEGFSFRKKDFYLVFVQTQAKYLANGYNRCNVGLNHLAFSVSSRAKVDFFKKQLEQQQVTLLYPKRYPYAGGKDHYACFFEDPDRIKLEIVARRKD